MDIFYVISTLSCAVFVTVYRGLDGIWIAICALLWIMAVWQLVEYIQKKLGNRRSINE